MVISLTRLKPSRTEKLQCQNLIDNFNFGRLVGNSIECSLVVASSSCVVTGYYNALISLIMGKLKPGITAVNSVGHWWWHSGIARSKIFTISHDTRWGRSWEYWVSSGEIPAWEPTWRVRGGARLLSPVIIWHIGFMSNITNIFWLYDWANTG